MDNKEKELTEHKHTSPEWEKKKKITLSGSYAPLQPFFQVYINLCSTPIHVHKRARFLRARFTKARPETLLLCSGEITKWGEYSWKPWSNKKYRHIKM